MPDQLMKTFGIDSDLAVIEGRKNQYLYCAEAEEACKWGAIHELLMQLYKRKGFKAMDCITQVHQHAISSISQFSSVAFDTVEQVVRSPSEQAYVEAAVQPLMALHTQAITGVAQLGDTNIAHEASSPVSTTPPRKWWWQK